MRWKGWIFLAVLAGAGLVLSLFFLDQWVESGLEKAGTAIVGAKVEIDDLDLSITGLSIEFDRLQVTDPHHTMRNILETGRTAFKMNLAALLRKKTVIREMTLTDVRTGTPRETDGAVPKKPKKEKKPSGGSGVLDKARDKLAARVRDLPVMQFDPDRLKENLNLDSLIAKTDLTLPQKMDSAKTEVMRASENWEAFFREFQPEDDLRRVRATIQEIDPSTIKTAPELAAALEKVRSAQRTLKSLQDTVKTRREQFVQDFNRAGFFVREADDWFQEDYNRVLAKARLPDFSVKNIGLILFGGAVVHRADQVFGLVQTVRKYMPEKSDEPAQAKPQRQEGRTIHYASRHGYPSFLIEKAHLSGRTGSDDETPGLKLVGEAAGITSQPPVYGRPTTIDLSGEKEDGRSVRFSAVLDHVGETARDRFELNMGQVSLNNVTIQQSDYLPGRILDGTADIRAAAEFEGDRFDISFDVRASGLRFDFSSMNTNNRFVDIVRDVIRRLNVVTLNARISGRGDDLTFRLDSNIDDRVSAQLRAMSSDALRGAQEKVRARLNRIRQEKTAEVNSLYREKRVEVQTAIDAYAEQVEAQRVAAEAKIEQIQKDIESRKKAEEDKLKDKAKDMIEGLF